MFKNFFKKAIEAATGVLPVTLIILAVDLLRPMGMGDFVSFLFGALLLIVGLTLYNLGSGASMEFMGDMIGSEVAKSKSRALILAISGAIGTVVTVAEPDLAVFAGQVNGIPGFALILGVAAGVGVFTVIAVLRLILKVSLKWVLLVFYAVIFLLAFLLPADVVPLSFDSSGVTTGPLTVPFIMAMGSSLSVAFGGKDSQDSSFGIVGVCSIGPIIAVMLLGLVMRPSAAVTLASSGFASASEVLGGYASAFPSFLKEMAVSLAPVIAFFLIYNFAAFRLSAKRLFRTFVGAAYVYIGLSVFLLGANIGFVPAGRHIGETLASSSGALLIIVGAVLGAVIVLAEPAVHVLTKQVEEVTGGVIKRRTILIFMCVSMAISVGLAMTRIVFDIDIKWVLCIGYATALGLMFIVPGIFTGIAFDSGGVASGAMTAAFLLPMASGAVCAICGADDPNLGSYIMRNAFGVVALVAMTPLVAIQILGLVYKLSSIRSRRARTEELTALLARDGEVIDLEMLERDLSRHEAKEIIGTEGDNGAA